MVLGAGVLLGAACGEKPVRGAAGVGTVGREDMALRAIARQLAEARVEQAKSRRQAFAHDEALAWAVGALAADPESTAAKELVRDLLATTRWPLANCELAHGMSVSHLSMGSPGTLCVALTEDGIENGWNTLVRWDTAALKIESVLFPSQGSGVDSMVPGARERALVLQRDGGDGRVHLLCDGKSLRPVCELGPLPPDLTAEAVVATSASGLLLAHPEQHGDNPTRLVWRIRDAATGGIIRSSDPVGPDVPAPVAAWLDDQRLRVLLKDGSLAEVPVSPVEPVVRYRPTAAATVLQARFGGDGGTVLGLWGQGDGRPPLRREARFSLVERDGAAEVVWQQAADPPDARWWDSPWGLRSSWWNSLLRDHGVAEDPPAVRIEGRDVIFSDGRRAPIRGARDLTAMAFGSDALATGSRDGMVRIYEWLPLPRRLAPQTEGGTPQPADLTDLCVLLAGMRYDPDQGRLVEIGRNDRQQALDRLAKTAAAAAVPGLDFGGVIDAARKIRLRTAPGAAWLPLWDRLARADPTGDSWPRWLRYGQALGDSRWHQDLTEAVALRQAGEDGPATAVTEGDASPWLAQRRMREIVRLGDAAALEAAITATGGKGPAMATALALALDGDQPAQLERCLKAAVDLPPMLSALAKSRQAWLEKRPADALSCWPDEFPELAKVRSSEDWDGWEQEDFGARYRAHLKDLEGELAAYDVAAAETPAEREKRAMKLLDPATRGVIGRRRLADHCLKGALAMAEKAEQPELIRQLARRGRDLGAAPEPCLRVEALTHTRMKNHAAAHPLWVKLLTEFPVETHQPNDYAEAAYTAFEIGDPTQAMEILTTGINRFGHDAAFALRAGWIALLTGNHGRAYQFLLAGLRVGYAAEQEENACLLLAVAASLAGFPEDAATHYLRLLELEPEWEKPATAEGLDWPEELKAAILQLISGPVIELPEQPMEPGMEPLPEW